MRCAPLFAAVFLAASAAGADPAPDAQVPMALEPPIYRVELHYLIPGKEKVYEEAVAGLVAALHAEDVALPDWDFSVASDGGSLYATLDPTDSWASLDRYDADGTAVAERLGARMKEFHEQARSARQRESEFFIQGTPSADDPGALGENGRDFLRADFFYGRDWAGLVGALKSVQRIYRASHVALSCRIYRAATGEDLPLLILIRAATDKAGYAAEEAKLSASDLRDVAQQLDHARQSSRKTQAMDLTIRQDLSYHVPRAP